MSVIEHRTMGVDLNETLPYIDNKSWSRKLYPVSSTHTQNAGTGVASSTSNDVLVNLNLNVCNNTSKLAEQHTMEQTSFNQAVDANIHEMELNLNMCSTNGEKIIDSENVEFEMNSIVSINISNKHLSTNIIEPRNNESFITNTNTNKTKLKCSICKQDGHNNRFCKTMTVPVSAPNIEVETDVKVKAPVKVEMPTLPSMDKAERVKRLREHLTLSKVNHEDQVMKLATLKEAHTYCVIHGVSAQQYGPLLERFIRTKFNYIKNKAEDCTGDCSKDGKNSEVKVSLGGATHTKFNFVQIRPSHDCETYILTAYNLSSENVESEGELYIFKVPKEDIKKIVVSFGGYAHGTIKEHGKITIESLNDEKSTKEYALRPTINDACWKALMPFKVSESGL